MSSSFIPDTPAATIALEDMVYIDLIVDRVLPMAKRANVSADRQEWIDYVLGAHCKGMPLELEDLLYYPLNDFAKDMFGLRANWDKHEKRVRDFVPLCAYRPKEHGHG